MLSAGGCLGDTSHCSARLWIQLIPGLDIDQTEDLLARTAMSLLPGEGSSIFLGGVEGSWKFPPLPSVCLTKMGPAHAGLSFFT